MCITMSSILGVRVDSVTRAEAIGRVGEMLRGGGQHIITTPNPEFIVAAQGDSEFRGVLNRASLALPDGVGLMLAARVLGMPLKEHIAGSDFVFDIAKFAARNGYSIYLLGAGEGVAQVAAERLKIKDQRLKIVGAAEGPINDLQLTTYNLQLIRNAAPDFLLVALGHGKQEKWIAAHLHELPSVKIAMGVGGVFDFLAGRIRRAPRLMRALGLEWLWRLILEPRRLPRILRATIIFPLLAIREGFRKIQF